MQEEPNKYVKELTQEKYKYGFTTEVHTDIIEKRRTGVVAGVSPESIPLLVDHGDACMGTPHYP